MYVQYLIDERFLLMSVGFKVKGRWHLSVDLVKEAEKPATSMKNFHSRVSIAIYGHLRFPVLFLRPSYTVFQMTGSVLHSLKSFLILSLIELMELQSLYALADS